VTAAVATHEDQLQRLYGRFKSLTLATTSALLLERPVSELQAEVDALLVECTHASSATAEPSAPLEECVRASSALAALVRHVIAGDSTAAELEQLRLAHLRLRRQVWTVLPFEYVPCCASGARTHRGE
jgi:hypothetical protein